jgi:pimeloyl-ACP methyl ester carboxylesterase
MTIEITEHSVRAPKGTIYAKLWTPEVAKALPPIVLWHDSIGCVDMWRGFPALLAARLGRPILAYDRLGFGRSSRRRDMPSVRFVSEEAEIWVSLILSELRLSQFVAMGHSVGGSMAVVAAARFPQHCQAVITESAQPYVEDHTLCSIAAAKVKFSAPAELAKLERYHGDKSRWVVDAWTDTWLSPEFRNWNIRAELAEVKCPLLAIHGEKDEFGSLAFPEVLSTLSGGPSEKLILPGCGHIPHREMEIKVLQKIEGFLARTIGVKSVGSG